MNFKTFVRLPARLTGHFGTGPLKLWLFARAHDAKGSGRSTFPLQFAANHLDRCVSSVRAWLTEGKRQGLFRNFTTENGICTVYYASLCAVAQIAQLEQLGPIAEVDLDSIRDLTVLATEIEAEALQRASIYAAKARAKELGQKPRMLPLGKLIAPSPPCGTPSCVLGGGKRFVSISEGSTPYGASQAAIASHRRLDVRTVQRHLSNFYRACPSPVRGYRMDLAPIDKKQIAQRLPRSFQRSGIAQVLQYGRFDCNDRPGRYRSWGDRIYHLKTNVYAMRPGQKIPKIRKDGPPSDTDPSRQVLTLSWADFPHHFLVPCRYRRKEYRKLVQPTADESNDKSCLSKETASLGISNPNTSKKIEGSHPRKKSKNSRNEDREQSKEQKPKPIRREYNRQNLEQNCEVKKPKPRPRPLRRTKPEHQPSNPAALPQAERATGSLQLEIERSPDYIAPGQWRPQKGGLIAAPDGFVYEVAGELPKLKQGFYADGVEVWCKALRGDPLVPPHFPVLSVRPAEGMRAGDRAPT